ncbi:phytase [Endozoicomonas sp. 4G]|uniref:phytase n=1 Tax=Endozoicomonas sp. 4G TaxID=2872754 RepID=UPI00207915A0|nr:phytase [Endozoicomonas sp. 4G]
MNSKSALIVPLSILLGGCPLDDDNPVTNLDNDTAELSTTLKTNRSYDDIADAAVWVSEENNDHNLLVVTLEGDGLAAFDAQGQEVFYEEGIKTLGADIRYNIIDSNNNHIDLLAVGLPDDEAIGFYHIENSSDNRLIKLNEIETGFAAESICLYQNITTKDLTATLVSEEGKARQYKLKYDGTSIKSVLEDEQGNPKHVREFSVGGELSACVVDDETSTLYIAEKDIGIWAYGADVENVKERRLVDSVEPLGNLGEIEGLELAYSTDGNGYLVVADEIKGLALYQRNNTNDYVTSFTINGIDETKALAIAPDAFWVANTEADAPVYEKLLTSSLTDFLYSKNIRFPTLVSHRELSVEGVALVKTSGETVAVDDDGDAADDPAFWLNPDEPSKSLILATNKQAGLMAYNLNGEELQFLNQDQNGNDIEPNNIDLRNNIRLESGETISLAAASNRKNNTIALYKIQAADGQDPIVPITVVGPSAHSEVPELASNLSEVYGLCMYAHNGNAYVFVNGKDGKVEQWELTSVAEGFEGEIVRTLSVNSQPEGCVVDDETDTLYLGEENYGIWAFDAQPNAGTEATELARIDNKTLTADVEGLTLFNNGFVKYLIASSQGSNSYTIYDLNNNNEVVGTFALIGDDSKGLDGASDTDGIDVIAADLGENYPEGLFIAQDWYNIDKNYENENQNFKLASWKSIMDAIQN